MISLAKITPAPDVNECWDKIASLSKIDGFRSVQGKSEYGLGTMGSEAGFQFITLRKVQRLAKEQNLNVNKATAISYGVGNCFPPFGSVGMAAVKEYVRNRGLSVDNLEVYAIEHELYRSDCKIITPELDEALHAYYENTCSIPEVNVVRYCQLLCRRARELAKQGMLAGEALNTAFKDYSSGYHPENGYELHEDANVDIPDDVRKHITDTIEMYIDYCAGMLGKSEEESVYSGIYRAIHCCY